MLRRPRLLYIAFSLLVLHVAAAAVMKHGPVGFLVSDSILLAGAITAAGASFQASRRSHYLSRAFWFLTGCSFVVWALAQSFDLVLEDILHLRALPSSVLPFFLAFVPMLAAVFVFEYRENEPIGAEVVLDGLQLLVLIVASYAFFVLIPTARYGSDATWELRLYLLHLRNLLLAIGLTGRAILARSNSTRRLYAPMAAIIALFAATSWVGNHTNEISVILDNSYWTDPVWTLLFALVTLFATRWDEPADAAEFHGRKQRIWTLLLVYGPSVLFPIVLFLKFKTVMRSQIVVGLATMLISLVLYTVRLALLQSRQNAMMQALSDSASRYRSLFERNMAGVFRSTVAGRLIDFNSAFAQMFGYTREELLNTPSSELYRGGAEERSRRIEERRKGAHSARFEMEYIRKDGSPLWAMQNVTIVKDENGAEVMEGTLLDVTDRHLLELQLRQAQKMEAVGRLAGGVAHDFNNLLTIINGYSELQLQASDPGTPVSDYAEQIRAAGTRAASLTRQLLAFSRQQVLQPQVVNLNTVLINLEKMLLRLIGEHIQVNTIMAPILGSVKVDPGQIEQVVMNLVLNARDAMPTGGKLTLETANLELTEGYVRDHRGVTPGQYVQLTVSDTGAGMDTETLARIFEPFFTTKEQGKGTGLGLATVYGIVKQSGGHIWAYSEVARGTTFKIYLPRVDNLPAKSDHERSYREEQHGTETILVVEDDRALRDLTESILAARGYRVLAAETPEEVDLACQRLGNAIDLLLTDVVMPVMSGREIAARVVGRCPTVKVLYMSGYTSDAIVHHGVLEQGIAFLQKPFTPSSLVTKVREVLDGTSPA